MSDKYVTDPKLRLIFLDGDLSLGDYSLWINHNLSDPQENNS